MLRISRFNRNIVECKLKWKNAEEVFLWVLIETLWNVNYTSRIIENNRNEVLIETLWNVNSPA